MRKTIAAIAMMLAIMAVMLMVSCDSTPEPMPEDRISCCLTVENRTGHRLGWNIRKAEETKTYDVRYTTDLFLYFSLDKGSSYILDIYMLGKKVNKIKDDVMTTETEIVDSMSLEIGTGTCSRLTAQLKYYPENGMTCQWVNQ